MFDICFYASNELGQKEYAKYFVNWEIVKQLEVYYPTVTNTINYVNNYYTEPVEEGDDFD